MAKTVKEALEERGGGKPLLKGSDLKKSEGSIKIKILDVRDAPKTFGCPYIVDIKCHLTDFESWAPNKTSVKNLADQFGENDPSVDWKGKTVTLNKMLVSNPKTGQMVYGLFYGNVLD